MSHLVVFSAIITSLLASDFCAWNRAATPVSENNAGTYNWLNGEFNRDKSTSYGDTWQGMTYYKMEITSCYVPEVYLYRYLDSSSFPAVNTWVISSGLGTKPEYGYAYCNVTTDPASPAGDCDGNWMVGAVNAQVKDEFFQVQVGGCPQIECASLIFGSEGGDFWTTGNVGSFAYESPNVYKQSNAEFSESGFFYLFFSPKTWRWAVNEYITDYEDCELYKSNKGFTSVADVTVGAATGSGVGVDEGDIWYYTIATGETTRYIQCEGSVDTPAPTTAATPIPTYAPVESGVSACYDSDGNLIQWTSPSWADYCANLLITPAPTTIQVFTSQPTMDTAEPTSGNSPVTSPTKAPSITYVAGTPSAAPTPPTPSPTSDTSSGGDDDSDDGSGSVIVKVWLGAVWALVAMWLTLM